ncbi:UNVERIFIED_CONTAM: hypothetical protein NCL1_50134 [Trichonephila clavipes]
MIPAALRCILSSFLRLESEAIKKMAEPISKTGLIKIRGISTPITSRDRNPSHVGIDDNGKADLLVNIAAKGGVSSFGYLTFSKLSSHKKIELNHPGRNPPSYPWYFGRNPGGSLSVDYTGYPLNCGDELLQNETRYEPGITLTGLNQEKLHTLIMFASNCSISYILLFISPLESASKQFRVLFMVFLISDDMRIEATCEGPLGPHFENENKRES